MSNYLILYDVYHDSSALDPQIFITLDAARLYIHSLGHFAEVLPDGSDLSAGIYEIGDTALNKIESWYQVESYWHLPAGYPVWVEGYDAYKEAERLASE